MPYIITIETLMVTKTPEERKKQYLKDVEQKEENITAENEEMKMDMKTGLTCIRS